MADRIIQYKYNEFIDYKKQKNNSAAIPFSSGISAISFCYNRNIFLLQ